jgi:hypothetical protein
MDAMNASVLLSAALAMAIYVGFRRCYRPGQRNHYRPHL